MREFLIPLLSAFVLCYGLFVLALYLFQRNLMYHPGAERPAMPRDFEAVEVASEDGLLVTSWWAKSQSADHPTLVYFHGNAGDPSSRVEKVQDYREAGWGVVFAGYRGFAGNPGAPSEQGLSADARAIFGFLEGRGLSPSNIILYGESLGSGVAVRLAAERAQKGAPAAAVVLEAPFTSMAAAAQSHYPWTPAIFLVKDRWDSLGRIDGIQAPLLVVHGTRDRTVPHWMGEALVESAHPPKRFVSVEGAGHVNLDDFGLQKHVIDFISKSK
ncbi:MAG: alpha/beta hydrolase [Magnetovibrionaceae bacterium]